MYLCRHFAPTQPLHCPLLFILWVLRSRVAMPGLVCGAMRQPCACVMPSLAVAVLCESIEGLVIGYCEGWERACRVSL